MEASCFLLMLELTTFCCLQNGEHSQPDSESLLYEFRSHWNNAIYSHISRKNNKSLPLLPFLSLQVIRKNYDECEMKGNFS